MAILTVQKIVKAGIVPSFVAATDAGDSFPNTGKEYVELIATGAQVTATVVQQSPCDQLDAVSHAAHDVVVVIASGARKKFGPFDPAVFNDSNGRAQMTFVNGTANGTIGVFAAP